jgi:bacteriorhodopsin
MATTVSPYIVENTTILHALQGHLALGAASMCIFACSFGLDYLYTKKEQSRISKALIFASSFFAAFHYIILLILYSTQDSAFTNIGPVFLRFFSWFLSTPPILATVVLLETTSITDILFLCMFDGMMIVSGYMAYTASQPAAIWSFYAFSFLNAYFIIQLMFNKYYNLIQRKSKKINTKFYRFLCIYTLIIWGIFPIRFILYKTNVISFEVETMIYVYLDILAKGFFGMVLVGARDMIDDKRTRMVRFARSIVHIFPADEPVEDISAPSSMEIIPVNGGPITRQPHSLVSPKNEEVVEMPLPSIQEN